MRFEAGQDADGREIHQVLLSNAYSQDLIFFIFYDRDMYRVQNYNTWKLVIKHNIMKHLPTLFTS